MNPRLKFAALAAAVVLGGPAWPQDAPGAIEGTVLTAGGKPIARANIYYGRTGRAKGKAAASVLPPVLAVKSGLDGRFVLANLPPGGWTVCVEARGFLNPCHWGNAPAFHVAAGQTVSRTDIRLDPAEFLLIRINDPQSLLVNEGKAAGALLQIGVHAPSGAFQRAVLTRREANSREYTIAVPPRAAAKLFVSGGAFQLSDDAGLPLAKSGKLTSVIPPEPRPDEIGPRPIAFTVTSLGKP